MKKLKTTLLSLSLLLATPVLHAEVAVIVNPSIASDVPKDEIRRIFLGKSKSLPGGEKIIPINQDKGSAAREEFNDKVLNKSESQLKSYWSKLIFTGKGQPPKNSGKDEDIIKLISSDAAYIGYIDKSKVTDSVKVLASF